MQGSLGGIYFGQLPEYGSLRLPSAATNSYGKSGGSYLCSHQAGFSWDFPASAAGRLLVALLGGVSGPTELYFYKTGERGLRLMKEALFIAGSLRLG